MYYIRYCYPLTTDPENPDAEHVDICTKSIGRPVPGWGMHEWGPFLSIDATRAELEARFPGRRREDAKAESEAISLNDTLIERWRPGRLRPMGHTETTEWIGKILRQEVTADMSAKQVEALAAELDSLAELKGLIPYGDTADYIRDYLATLPE